MLHNKRKIVLTIVIICLIGLVGLGISYAYWKFTYIQTDNNIAISKCLKLDMTNEKNEINLNNMYPISDEDGRKLAPYSFKITNTCSMSAEYKVNLEMLEGTTLNSKYLASLVNNDDIKLLSSYDSAKTTISGSVESRTLDTNILTPGASKEYSISLWMDKSVTLADDAQNKSFSAKVIIDASMYTGIVDKIVAQLDTTGKCPTVNDDGTVNVTSAESENSLLCSAPDNYGTSYYYRGNVSNNYVKFAGFYWRIVRINGDGSIRLIYDGTSGHENGENIIDDNATVVHFNAYYDDNAFIGYMYGTPSSSTYAETHANINDSTIKAYVDNWYETNLKGKILEQYLYDNSFCNDRTMTSGTGTGKATTWYIGDASKSLKCLQKNDAFTINVINKGNGNLKYPIGLLNVSEFYLGGGERSNNKKFYLYTGKREWTMTPFYYMGSNAAALHLNENGAIDANYVNDFNYARPVINLKPNSIKSGDGTINNPYVVE